MEKNFSTQDVPIHVILNLKVFGSGKFSTHVVKFSLPPFGLKFGTLVGPDAKKINFSKMENFPPLQNVLIHVIL